MDSITHTVFGLALYAAVDKKDMDKTTKRAYLVSLVGASLIPDIDVVSQLWDEEGLYQMWHRGITHSLFLTPVFALFFWTVAAVFFKTKDKRLFFLSWLAVFIHNTSDLFNAWGTGYLEPFSNIRITFGTIPIIDFVFWVTFLCAYIFSKRNKLKSALYFRIAWVVIVLHVSLQSLQGYVLYNQYEDNYDQIALAAEFIPWKFTVITKEEETVSIYSDSVLDESERKYVIQSKEQADLSTLFKERPEAKTLTDWSPFVVIVDDNDRIGVYDPRFYRNGQSFLFEYIEKN